METPYSNSGGGGGGYPCGASARLEAILAEETTISVVFVKDCPGLRSIVAPDTQDASSSTSTAALGLDDPKQQQANMGDKADLPLWLARELLREGVVAVEQAPRVYNARARGMLAAAPRSLNLGSQQYYYELGREVSSSMGDQALVGLLTSTLVSRAQGIYDKALNVRDTDTSQITNAYTANEKLLFGIAYADECDFERWKNQIPRKVERSKLLPAPQQKQKQQKRPASNGDQLNSFQPPQKK